jgi:AP-3 complex subunit mu
VTHWHHERHRSPLYFRRAQVSPPSRAAAWLSLRRSSTPLLEHAFAGRPASSSTLLPLFLAHSEPRPPLVYLPTTNPATLLYSLIHDQLLFLCPCSVDSEPLGVLEFLHRVADALQDYFGSPLLASKVEANYDVIAQLLNEMVDGGLIACTEPNALRDVVDAPSLIKSLLGGVGLPSTTPSSLTPSATPFSLSSRPSPRLGPANVAQSTEPVPWRRANVRHTSNEMYVDIVETLHVTMSPSGRPLAAMANGTIAFTAKVSGVPDLLLQLGCPGGISSALSLPVFHPCVRLNRWRERPGELSFVPPDGRFVLAGYEVDLLGPASLDSFSTSANGKSVPKLNIPATVSVHPSLGPTGSDFEVRLQLNPRFTGKSPSPHSSSVGSKGNLGRGIGGAGFSSAGTTAAPTIEEMMVNIPLPASVKNVAELRGVRGVGDASYAPGDRSIEWRISSRDIGSLMSQDRGGGMGATATLRGTVIGQEDDSAEALDNGPVSFATSTYDYNDDQMSSYQVVTEASNNDNNSNNNNNNTRERSGDKDVNAKRAKLNKVLMPSCATVSFSVKGWLPSGIKVESLNVDQKKSRGLGGGVTPYKGVKYLCVSRQGVESRC